MLDAAVKALSQILSPPMRAILWKSVGLAVILIVVVAISLQRALSWFAGSGEVWAETALGPGFHTPLLVLSWFISIAAGLGIVLGAVFLMPAITSLVASVFVDDVADIVEREHYPAERPGQALPIGRALIEGTKTAALTILVYLVALPFVFFAGVGVIVFFFATRIFRARGDALPLASRGESDAPAERRAGVHRRPRHRRLRLDPDRQSGDAAVRHGLHGPYAQTVVRRTSRGVDRAGA